MPFYYLHVNDELESTCFHAVDLAAAKCEATKMAGKIICDDSGAFWDTAEWSMMVSDKGGLTLFQLQFIGIEAPAIARTKVSAAL
jgi:hypothetical protein